MTEEEFPEWINKTRKVLIRGVWNGRLCPPGMDYCWECGYVAPYQEFLKNNQCPNPNCPHPKLWND